MKRALMNCSSLAEIAKGLASAVFALSISAQSTAAAEPMREEPRKTKPQQEVSAPDAQKQCAHIANIAREARNELQQKQLADLEQRIRQKLTELEARKSELQAMLDRHESLLRGVDQTLVDVYSRMRPDAAASQMVNLEENQAAAILMRLRPKYASAILNEMDSAHAADVVKKLNALSSATRLQSKP
jgi:flagellar motility protein MotE (MotC chaperone)